MLRKKSWGIQLIKVSVCYSKSIESHLGARWSCCSRQAWWGAPYRSKSSQLWEGHFLHITLGLDQLSDPQRKSKALKLQYSDRRLTVLFPYLYIPLLHGTAHLVKQAPDPTVSCTNGMPPEIWMNPVHSLYIGCWMLQWCTIKLAFPDVCMLFWDLISFL